MRKLFIFLLLLLAITSYAQTENSPSTHNSVSFNSSISTGSFTIKIPLFTIPTANPDFSISASLDGFSSAMLSNNTKDHYLKKGWEFNFIPVISTIGLSSDGTSLGIDEELFYKQLAEKIKDNDTENLDVVYKGVTVYTFNIFGMHGTFHFEHTGEQVILKKLYSSDFVDIKPVYEFIKPVATYINSGGVRRPIYNNNTKFSVTSFEITDKQGYVYLFSEIHGGKGSYFGGHGGMYSYERKASFLITQIKDRFGTVLMDYHYDTVAEPNSIPEYPRKALSRIEVSNIGTINLIRPYTSYNAITFKNKLNETLHNISLEGDYAVIFKDQDDIEKQRYSIWKNISTKSAQIGISYPYGGSTSYTMELNDYSYYYYGPSFYAISSPLQKKEGTGYRLRTITNYSNSGQIASEEFYTYQMSNNLNDSSGGVPDIFIKYKADELAASLGINYLDCIYKKVAIEKPGIGKTMYIFNPKDNFLRDDFMYANLYTDFPYEILTYDTSGKLTSKIVNEIETYLENTKRLRFYNSPIIEKTKKVAIEYASDLTKSKQIETTQIIDRLTRNVLSKEIKDLSLNETFREENTYVKKGTAYVQETVKKYKNHVLLNQSYFDYLTNGNLVSTKIAKGNLPLETEKEITKYDDFGNILEYKTKEGTVVSQIWGYHNSKVIAELKNVAYSSIASSTITDLKNYSKSGYVTYSEANLKNTLNTLRTTYPNGFITTYTYLPAIGISSITDANGVEENYQYDAFNRLYRVLNHEGLIVKQYEYKIRY